MPEPLPPLQPLLPAVVRVQPVAPVAPAQPAASGPPAWAAAARPAAPLPAAVSMVPPAVQASPQGRRREDAQRCWALVPCAGSGSRARSGDAEDGPKQYRAVAGKPLVLHTLAALAAVPRIAGTLVVVAPGDPFFADHIGALQGLGLQVADCGGATRAASVAAGLAALAARGAAPHDWVLVHDAARCLVTPALVDALIDACQRESVGGLLALPLADTLKRAAAGRVAETLERSDKWLAQTPQMFRLGLLADALLHAGAAVTDEASAVEALGHAPRLVPGSAHNFKVTWPEDFVLAEALLLARASRSATVDRYQGRRDDAPLVHRPLMY